jgi:hypothetical protein
VGLDHWSNQVWGFWRTWVWAAQWGSFHRFGYIMSASPRSLLRVGTWSVEIRLWYELHLQKHQINQTWWLRTNRKITNDMALIRRLLVWDTRSGLCDRVRRLLQCLHLERKWSVDPRRSFYERLLCGARSRQIAVWYDAAHELYEASHRCWH